MNFLSLHHLSQAVGSALIAITVTLTCTASRAAPGELDASFGSAGSSPVRPSGVSRNTPGTSFASNTISAGYVAVRSDGGYYALVPCITVTPSGGAAMCVSSYSETAVFDSSFGIVSLPGTGTVAPLAIAVDRDDNVWIAGICADQSCLQKVLRNGQVARNLGELGNQSVVQAPSMVAAGAIDIGYDGKIAVGGRCFNSARYYPCATRLLPNGVPDPSFLFGATNGWGNDPFALNELLTDGFVRKIKLASDGRIYAAGRCVLASGERMCAAMIEANGTRQTYAVPNSQDGLDYYSFYIAFPPSSTLTRFSDFAVQTDGLMLLYGTCNYAAAPTRAPCLTRIQPGVGADVYFGSAGHVRPYLRPEPMDASGMVLRQDGSIVTLANCDVTVSSNVRRQLCVVALGTGGNFSLQFLSGGNAANDIEFDAGSTPSRLLWDGVGAARYFDRGLLAVASCPDSTGFRWLCVARISLAPPAAPHCKPDLDGDRRALATTDAALIARVAKSPAGSGSNATLGNLLTPTATRNSWAALSSYLNGHCGTALTP